MQVKEITYRNFRNIGAASVAFTPGVNILCGSNAQGKTNALEGIYCFACGKSFRGVKDRELISFGETSGSVSMTFADARREQRLSLSLSSEKPRQMQRNGVPVKRSADFVGTFHGVLFCPEHLMMIKGAPQMRRAFLDAAICQLRPAYLAALADYARILKQRNALLKNAEASAASRMPLFEVLTRQMAEVNTRITVTRSRYVRLLSGCVERFLDDMTAGRERAQLTYESDVLCGAAFPDAAQDAVPQDAVPQDAAPQGAGAPQDASAPQGAGAPQDAAPQGAAPQGAAPQGAGAPQNAVPDSAAVTERFFEDAMAHAGREFAAGTTLHGCHRDDIGITLNGREARLYASQGQDRSIALAMKLGEGELSKTVTGEYPVFLFDDVLSELDAARQKYLMQRLGGRQVILTSCSEELFSRSDVHMIRVEGGTYREE